MKKILILALFFAIFMPGLVLLTPSAQAQGFLDLSQQEGFKDKKIPTALGQTAGLPADPRIIIVRLIKIVLTFLATIFLVLILFAGFKWMMSRGNESDVEQAKAIITQAVIGLIIIFSAYSITYFVVRNVYEKSANIKIW